MKETRITMGMPATVEILDASAAQSDIEDVFSYFTYVDNTFSTYKSDSEISKINRGELRRKEWSRDMQEVFSLAEETHKETDGFFNILNEGVYDPSGIVKGWAIHNAAKILRKKGFKNFYVDAGGDVEVEGMNGEEPWRIGIKNPRKPDEIVKIVLLSHEGIATSGAYERGAHIYNPHTGKPPVGVQSMSVIGKNAYEADRFATAAFAMGVSGISFIEGREDLEGYMIDDAGVATMTGGFSRYVLS